MHRFLILVFAVVTLASAAIAQPSAADPAAVRRAEMAKIAGLAGTWVGPGWRILPSGERIEYDQTVVATPKMNGLALVVEGKSQRRGPNAPPPGAGSLAVVTWEASENRYAFRSFTGGTLTDSDGALRQPGVFQWVVRGEGPWLRFTVDFSRGDWSEIGERSTDQGKSWTIVYGVEMKKAP
jgi:hypothetical protein